jgi:hypothetical protein
MGIFTKQSKGALATVACAGCVVGASVIPETMMLTRTMTTFKWTDVSLLPIDFNVGIQELSQVTADQAIKKHTGTIGSIAYVVRRPG